MAMSPKTSKALGIALLAMGFGLVLFRLWDLVSHRRVTSMALGTAGLMLALVGGSLVRRARRAGTDRPAT